MLHAKVYRARIVLPSPLSARFQYPRRRWVSQNSSRDSDSERVKFVPQRHPQELKVRPLRRSVQSYRTQLRRWHVHCISVRGLSCPAGSTRSPLCAHPGSSAHQGSKKSGMTWRVIEFGCSGISQTCNGGWGRPINYNSVHRQKMMKREILIIEQTDLHLTGSGSTICFTDILATTNFGSRISTRLNSSIELPVVFSFHIYG